MHAASAGAVQQRPCQRRKICNRRVPRGERRAPRMTPARDAAMHAAARRLRRCAILHRGKVAVHRGVLPKRRSPARRSVRGSRSAHGSSATSTTPSGPTLKAERLSALRKRGSSAPPLLFHPCPPGTAPSATPKASGRAQRAGERRLQRLPPLLFLPFPPGTAPSATPKASGRAQRAGERRLQRALPAGGKGAAPPF